MKVTLQKKKTMESILDKFFSSKDLLAGYFKVVHTFEYPLPYPNYDNFDMMSVHKWLLDEVEYSSNWQLLVKSYTSITVATYESIGKLEVDLVNLVLSSDDMAVIVQVAK